MVQIVTDSSSDIPSYLLSELGIRVVPAHILFGRKKFRDYYEMSSGQFFRMLDRSQPEAERYHPLTTQASPLEFYREFRAIELMGEDILCITLPRNLSALIESAELAAPFIEKVKVTIVDSRGVSGAQGLLVIQAARMARTGWGVNEIVKQLNFIQPKTRLYAVAETLDYLVRGNRVSVARGTLGNLLRINPILEGYDGEVESAAQARGMDAAYDTIIELLTNEYAKEEPIIAMTLNAVNSAGASILAERIRSEFNIQEMIVSKIGPTIGANIGPGAAGVAFSPAISFV